MPDGKQNIIVKKYTIQEEVVNKHMCSGCGVCFAICPANECIDLVEKSTGERIPQINKDKCFNCGLCLKICPSSSIHADVNSSPSVWIGHSKDQDQLIKSASGGLLTELLVYLLKSKRVDAIAVASRDDFSSGYPSSWFRMKWVTNEQELRDSAASKYFSLNQGKTLKELSSLPYRKVALVALPCAARAIKNAKKSNAVYSNKIKYIFSLFCGHTVTPEFIKFIADRNNISLSDVYNFSFRDKTQVEDTMKFNFRFDTKSGQSFFMNFAASEIGPLWTGMAFSINKCLYCADFDSPYADASFADVWLDKYRKDGMGHSFAVVNNNDINTILTEMMAEGIINLNESNYDEVRKAQSAQFRFKSIELAARLKVAALLGIKVNKNMNSYLRRYLHELTYSELLSAALLITKVRMARSKLLPLLGAKNYNRLFRLIEFGCNPKLFLRKVVGRIKNDN